MPFFQDKRLYANQHNTYCKSVISYVSTQIAKEIVIIAVCCASLTAWTYKIDQTPLPYKHFRVILHKNKEGTPSQGYLPKNTSDATLNINGLS